MTTPTFAVPTTTATTTLDHYTMKFSAAVVLATVLRTSAADMLRKGDLVSTSELTSHHTRTDFVLSLRDLFESFS